MLKGEPSRLHKYEKNIRKKVPRKKNSMERIVHCKVQYLEVHSTYEPITILLIAVLLTMSGYLRGPRSGWQVQLYLVNTYHEPSSSGPWKKTSMCD